MADDLDELQPRHRVEEVQSEQPLGLLQRGAQILQRDAGRIGGEDRARLHLRLEPGIDLLLQLQLFRHRLDDEIGVADALAVHVRHQPVKRVAHSGALAQDLAEQIGGALDRARDRLGLHVGERHPHVLAGAPGGDVAAHRAGADDVDVLDLVAGACELLHLLAQEEHADQVLRRRRHHQIGERRFFPPPASRAVAAVPFPEIDQRVRRRIMRLRRSLFRPRWRMREARKPRTGPRLRMVLSSPGLRALQPAGHRVLDRIADMALLRHGVDQPERFCLARVDGLAGQHHRHRLHRIDELREARGAAEAGMQAEHHLRENRTARPRSRSASGRPAPPPGRRRGRNRGSRRPSEPATPPAGRSPHARGRSRSRPRLGSVAPRNSLTSAPAMKPDVLAERMTRPVGRWLSSSANILSSSSITSAESVLALLPSRSNNSQATPSASRFSLKFLYGLSASGIGPSSSTRSPRTSMIFESMLTPSRSTSRRPARRRYIRWRCRAACRAASSR